MASPTRKKPPPRSSEALLQALLSGEGIGRPKSYQSPFAGSKPKVVKGVASPTVAAVATPPVDNSGFGVGPGGGGGGVPAGEYGSDEWALRTGGPGAMLWREIARKGVYGAMDAVNTARKKAGK